MSLGLKKKSPPIIRPRPARKRGQARQAERVARRERRRGERKKRSATTTPGARLGQHAEKLGKRVAEVAWRMVHGACRASEASRVMRHPLFQRGPRGLLAHKRVQAAETRAACPSVQRSWTRVLRVARSQGDKAAIRRKAANAPDCPSTAQKCRASSGAPRRQSVAAKRLFLSPSAFFEPAKKVRKNSKRMAACRCKSRYVTTQKR